MCGLVAQGLENNDGSAKMKCLTQLAMIGDRPNWQSCKAWVSLGILPSGHLIAAIFSAMVAIAPDRADLFQAGLPFEQEPVLAVYRLRYWFALG